MQHCSRYARDCISKCCDRFGGCPEYSGNPCHYFYAVQNSSNWSTENALIWMVYGLVGLVTLIAIWCCCCRNTSPRGMYSQRFIPGVGNTMIPAGLAASMIASNQLQANQMTGFAMNNSGFMGMPSVQTNPMARSMIMNSSGLMGMSPALGQPQFMQMGIGGGNPAIASGFMQNPAFGAQQQMMVSQQQQLLALQNQINETSGYGQEIEVISSPPILTSNFMQSPILQRPRFM